MRPAGGRRRGDAGFTLVELLVSITIMGIIGFPLTQSVLLGFKTTDATAADVSRSVAVHMLGSYFSGDVQSSEQVSAADTDCRTGDPGILLHLTWNDGAEVHRVSLGFDPATGTERNLVRWSCTESGGTTVQDKRVLGHFSSEAGDPEPISVRCDDLPCPAAPGTPAKVTLTVQPPPRSTGAAPTELTVRRRTA